MDINNPVIKLCMEGTRAELERRIQDAYDLYVQAWNSSQNDYEACIAAHYVARFQKNPEDELHWNQEALRRAEMVNDHSVDEFHPSLYLSLGRSYEILDYQEEAQKYYRLAAELGYVHSAA
jgi:hypothetical protein